MGWDWVALKKCLWSLHTVIRGSFYILPLFFPQSRIYSFVLCLDVLLSSHNDVSPRYMLVIVGIVVTVVTAETGQR